MKTGKNNIWHKHHRYISFWIFGRNVWINLFRKSKERYRADRELGRKLEIENRDYHLYPPNDKIG